MYGNIWLVVGLGWEYTLPIDGQGELAWSSLEKPFHLIRRRRLVRNRKNVDPKQLKRDEASYRKF